MWDSSAPSNTVVAPTFDERQLELLLLLVKLPTEELEGDAFDR
jgi:hypothetical protein